MANTSQLVDRHGRVHNYLRISLTDHCNLRCFYCMPEDGVEFQPKAKYLTQDEIIDIAKTFVNLGVKKIRLTGGEPLIRKDIASIITRLSELPVELAITTNGVLLDKYLPLFKKVGLNNVNISLDSLDENKNLFITKRDYYFKIRQNIEQLINEGIIPKLNVVVMQNVNDNEIIDFLELAKNSPLDVRFLEFMPFNGNQWALEKCFSFKDIQASINSHYGLDNIIKLKDPLHSTSKNYRIKGYQGSFGIISSITNPFCSGCNRIRLTADGKLKNCLFSTEEFDVLSTYRSKQDIIPTILDCLQNKKKKRAGLETTNDNIEAFEQNRSMITIGG